MIKVFLTAAFLMTLTWYAGFEVGIYVERFDTTKRIDALQAERVAREGKTDREWYSSHPEAKGS